MMKKTDPSQKFYTRMRLWEFLDQYVIEATDDFTGSCWTISRVDGSMNLIDDIPQCSTIRVPKIWTIIGVIGILILTGSYLIVITEPECVGSSLGHPIFKVSSLKVFPCDHSLKNSPLEQKKMEAEFSGLLGVAEKTPGLYFSYNVNITPSAQRLHNLGDESKLLPLWRQADPRFFWNNYMSEVGLGNKPTRPHKPPDPTLPLDPYLLPVIQILISLLLHLNGPSAFQNFQAAIGKDIIDVTLITRRCIGRTGTRMWRRGADSDGFVANFVESEQIMQFSGHTASFVQIRGSIPFLWEQIVDLTYKPKFEIVKAEEAAEVDGRHFFDLRKKNGNVLAVDLVNKHGGEGRLSEKFSSSMQHVVSDNVRYLHFDFHHICGHVHFERLSMLYDQIEDFLVKNRYLLLNEKSERVEEQLRVVRTNCIDCLDRTNVTQYSGTPALKGDFVRCGQRTVQGILKDGCNALVRYYLNNFVDGTKQDAIDLLQGHYIVSVTRDIAPTSQKGGLEAVASFPLALSLVLLGFFLTVLSLSQVRYDLRHLFFSTLWASMSVAMCKSPR
ncbi:Phosphoinositide phosphatase SAC6 [Camellia lanceoleosa]|uniref:Phosphoinositide phosphatase SAC6 n=1 Tax=Camellia lanceoleosa TaxID=1840588 RepID=A0ACC0HYE5_9ERIC|nr:Phosphoinositide phosphatase SAC6 [Camellia lanceoleosa]